MKQTTHGSIHLSLYAALTALTGVSLTLFEKTPLNE